MKSMIAFVGVLGFVWISGCGGEQGPPVVKISGTVTLDETAVPSGQIVFRDVEGKDRDYAAPIQSGNYSLTTTPGRKKVVISWLKEEVAGKGVVGGIPGDPVSAANPALVMKEMIPETYNADSQLVIEITAGGSKVFPFELKSSKKN